MGAIEDYARLVVQVGVAVRPGQDVYISGQLDHAPFLRAIAAEAYRAQARFVDVEYRDPFVRRALVAEGADEALGWTPPWVVTKMDESAAAGAAHIHVSGGSNAEVYEGLDPARLARARLPGLEKAWLRALTAKQVAWTIVAYPTERWAVETLGEPDVERLWKAVAHVMRLDEPDPAAAWSTRLDELEARARRSPSAVRRIRYRGPGTELEVGLIAGSTLDGGPRAHHAGPDARREHAHRGGLHEPAPAARRRDRPGDDAVRPPRRDRRGARAAALRRRDRRGQGEQGEDIVRSEIALDDGARRLGELALVDASSRVGDTGIVFRNTLFDENAASHIAWGAGLAWTVDGIAPEEHESAGLNDSRRTSTS